MSFVLWMNVEEEKQTFLDHLEEARERIIVSLVAVAIFTVLGLIFADGLFHYAVVKPFDAVEVKPVVLNVTEALMVRFKVAMVAGIVFALPVIIFEIWRFVKPGLYRNEIRVVRSLFWCILFLFLLGMSFAYAVVLGLGLPIMKRFADQMGLETVWSLNSCTSFVLLLLFGFGAAFQLPVIMSALAKLGVVDYNSLKSNRSIALVIVLIVSALITPPDPGTMALMAVPLWLLFEISIMAVRFIGSKSETEIDSDSEESSEPETEEFEESYEGAPEEDDGSSYDYEGPEEDVPTIEDREEETESPEIEEPPRKETEEEDREEDHRADRGDG